jgi:hypothetical protein
LEFSLTRVLSVADGISDAAYFLPRRSDGLCSRVLLSVVMLAPLGILLGMPFPCGLRIVGEETPSLVSWAWGVNGFFTVIGTICGGDFWNGLRL